MTSGPTPRRWAFRRRRRTPRRRPPCLIHEADGATKDIKVKVIEAENVSGEGELLGCLGDMEITAKLPLGVGEVDVQPKK